MNRRMRPIGLGILVAASLAGCGHHEAPVEVETAPKPVHVTIATPETRTVERSIDVVGTLKGWEEVTVGAKKGGRVVRVRHDVGDQVKPDEPLVDLETIDADLAVDQAEKQLMADLAKVGVILEKIPDKVPTVSTFDVTKLPSVIQAQVGVERARQNLAREKNLVEKRAGTVQDLQNAENDLKNADAVLSNAILTARSILVAAMSSKAGIDKVRQARDDMEIRAPRPSKPPFGLDTPSVYAVARRSISEGEMIREGDPVMDLVIENPLRLWVNVPERYVAEVKAGQEVAISVASQPGKSFPGKVARISPAVESASRTFQVEAAVPNDAGLLRAGGFAKARIVTDSHARATIVPLDAVIRFAGVTKLFIADAKGEAHALEVETGQEGPGWVEVLTALPEGARVIMTGQARLAEGTPVVVRGTEPTPAGPGSPRTNPTPPATGG
ncbi:efflux RND transporter periplasmic adaptor subunit [Tundrisphaera sp. TA3]|uniref:efflux RND transporter periplasmic adaptor subunit n=1 Tax=Tundrisphaera sp. TA3 TaxID=3435775 RepID=UPI003EB6EAD9